MNSQPNPESTAEVLDQMAQYLRDSANEIERKAKRLRESGDFDYAGEVLNEVQNCFRAMRLDLLVIRPVREMKKAALGQSQEAGGQN